MVDKFNNDIVRLSVAQICQTIGYNTAQTAPMELLQDVLHRFLLEFSRDLRGKAEHANRSEANLKDTHLTMKSLNVNISELLDYVSNVEAVQYVSDLPKYPARKKQCLNLLKPGSNEVLTRPVHIYEYLPPMLQTKPVEINCGSEESLGDNVSISEAEAVAVGSVCVIRSNQSSCEKDVPSTSITSKTEYSQSLAKWNGEQQLIQLPNRVKEDEALPIREISSVVMTSGGYISPAIEGKLPDVIVPNIIEKFMGLDAPPPPPPQRTPTPHQVTLTSIDIKQNPITSLKEVNVNSGNILVPAGEQIVKNEATDNSRNDSLLKTVSSASSFPIPKQLKKGKKLINSVSKNKNLCNPLTMKSFNKSHRKAMKILQKLSKSDNNTSNDGLQIVNFDKNICGKINPALIASLPTDSSERLQLEKLLKKQAKQRQKLLKQQFAQEVASNKKDLFDSKLGENSINIPVQRILPIEDVSKKEDINSTVCNTNISIGNSTIVLKTDEIPTHVGVEPDKSKEQLDTFHEIKNVPFAMFNNQTELKLSNEPDRNKLNIFKKISKQKIPKLLSPNFPINTFNALESKPSVINLPSGTTITPAPAFSSINKDKALVNENLGGNCNLHINQTSGITLPMFSKIANTPVVIADDLPRPKKRGRKPGSKNQVKSTYASGLSGNTLKKEKTIKSKKILYGPSMQFNSNPLPANDTEPLNLSSMSQTNTAFNSSSNFQLGNNASGTAAKDMEPSVKGRNKRKKYKSKHNPMGLSSIDSSLGLTMSEQVPKKALIDTEQKTSFNLPVQNSNTLGNLDKNLLGIQTKLKSPISVKKQRPSPTQFSANLVTPFLSPTETNSGMNSFSNKQPLPMLPLYSFPPRPGLIPSAPGLFPSTVLSSYANSTVGVAGANMLIPQFLPFHTLNASMLGNMSTNDTANNLINMSSSIAQQGVDSVCSVKPLLPESNKINENYSESKHEVNGVAISSRSHSLHSPVDSVDLQRIEGLKKLCDDNSKLSANNFLIAKPPASLAESNVNYNKHSKAASAKGNADDPIEVSDDSEDSPNLINSTPFLMQSSSGLSTFHHNLQQTGILPEGPTTHFNNLFTSNNTTQKFEEKKTKTQPKSFSMNTFPASSSHPPKAMVESSFKLDLKGTDKFSLAGGADLIPIKRSDNSLFYPLSTVTAASSSSTVLQANIGADNEHATNYSNSILFEGVTITPTNALSSIDLKKRKDHKKNKKLKEGKLKKKKEKKEKLKNREKLDKTTKDLEKKIKKEKKRERMRLMHDSGPLFTSPISINTNLPAEQQPPPTEVMDETPIINLNPKISPNPNISPNQVPKITLKLGGCTKPPTSTTNNDSGDKLDKIDEKRGHSPELARFSPLVTRPPKLKTNDSQMAGIIATTTSVSANIGACETNSIATTTSNSTWLQGGTLSASSVLLPQQLLQTSKINIASNSNAAANVSSKAEDGHTLPQVPETNRPSSYVDSEGNRIWICPACGKVDDGSPMIGCDACDAWYHWVCVGISVAPKDNEDWFCRVCITKKKAHGSEKKRRRNKKNK